MSMAIISHQNMMRSINCVTVVDKEKVTFNDKKASSITPHKLARELMIENLHVKRVSLGKKTGHASETVRESNANTADSKLD